MSAWVRDVEVAEPLPAIPAYRADGTRVASAWLLVRVFTEPVGAFTVPVPGDGLAPGQVGAAVLDRLGDVVRARVEAAGGHLPAGLPANGVAVPGTPPFLAHRQRTLATAPPVTVVICTRDQPVSLARCLDSVLAQEYPRLRVLVVDNAPQTGATAAVVRAAAAHGPVDYLREPRPGLSRARNAAVRARPGELLAWLDDDEVADPHWLAELARAFEEHPEADVVTGAVVPAELETEAQIWFEEFGGHSKGRGFTPALFSPLTAAVQSPLYPLPPFGAGANMAWRPGVAERIGGFDNALGAGTPAMGGEDTVAFARVLLGGGTIAYRPAALTRHTHRRSLAELERQLYGYGVGLTAGYTSMVLADPRVLVPLARLIPTAWRDLRRPDGPRLATVGPDFPAHLLPANRRGMLHGPVAYLRGRAGDRRGRAQPAGHGTAR